MTKEINGIIVLGGHVQALGILRILGREGIPGIIIDSTKINISRHSKYCKEFILCDEENIISLLLDLGKNKKHENWLIMPTSDNHVKQLSVNKLQLEKYFKVSTDAWDKVQVFFNKKNTYSLLDNIGVSYPQTYFPNSSEDLENLKIEFPCIIKPAVVQDFYRKTKTKVFICNNKLELIKNYDKASNIIPKDEIIIQEIIHGSSENQYSACFLMQDNEPIVQLVARRKRQHPLDFGNATTYAETTNCSSLIESSLKILRSVGYNGICEVEYKYDEKTKEFKEGKRTFRDYLAIVNKELRDRLLIPKIDTLFVLTSYLYEKYKSISPSLKIMRTIPGIVDYSHFLELQRKDIYQFPDINPEIFTSNRIKIFYPGSCVRTNGLKFFLECSELLLKGEKIIFDIIFIFHIGDIEKIRHICKSLNISDRVTILPAVLPQYLPVIYKYIDILVLPEHGNTIANAGFPGKAAEYLASGKAIISTIFSDLTDYLIDDYNAMLSPIGNHETYSEKLNSLINNKVLREKLGNNAKATAKKYFDNKNSVKPYIDEINRA